MENSVLQFEAPKYKSSYIKVIGVGGGGTNAVNHMYLKGIEGVDFIICNTDDKSLDSSPVPTKIKLGKSGLGAGNNPAVARERSLEIGDEIKEILSHNTQMLFITAGMGGGTGTGAAPVIAQLAKEIEIDDDVNKILVVAIVTLPFCFEGRRRRLQAEEGIKELRKHVDAILIINNDKLRDFGKMGLREAFSKADDILLTAAKGIAQVITEKSYINVDFRDVNTVMQNSGVALMGSGIAEGEDRALKAIEMATSSVLLNDNSINGAKNVLLYFASGMEEIIDMDEMSEITDYIRNEAGKDVDVIWGAGFDANLGQKLSITLIATGFESKEFDIPNTRMVSKPKEPTVTPEVFPIPSNREGLFLEGDSISNPISQTTSETTEFQLYKPAFFEPEIEPVLISQGEKLPFSTADSSQERVDEVRAPLSQFLEGNTDSEEFYIKPRTELPAASTENQAEKIHVEVPFLAQNTSAEEYIRLRAERMQFVHEKLKTPQGIEGLEKLPAYEMFGMTIKDPEHSSKSEISRMKLNEGKELEEGNSFLFDQPD